MNTQKTQAQRATAWTSLVFYRPADLPRWPLMPASDEERHEFERLYASTLVGAATAELTWDMETLNPRVVEAMRFRCRPCMTVARVAEEMRVSVESATSLLDRGRAGVRRRTLDVLRLVCTTEEEAIEELRTLLGALSQRAPLGPFHGPAGPAAGGDRRGVPAVSIAVTATPPGCQCPCPACERIRKSNGACTCSCEPCIASRR